MAKSRRVRSRRGLYAWGLKPPTTQGGAGPIIGCAYPLDAPESQVQALGFASKLTMSADEQTGSYVISDTSTAQAALADGVQAGTATPITAASGKVAVEMGLLSFPACSGAGVAQRMIASLPLFEPALANVWNMQVIATQDAKFDLRSSDSFGFSDLVMDADTAPSEVGIVMDHNNSMIYIRNKGQYYVPTSWTPADISMGMSVRELNPTVSPPSAEAGSTVSVRARTDSTEYTGDYGSGTTDACGTALPDSTTYPLDATAAELQGAGLDGRLTPVDSLTALHTFPDGIIQTDLGYSAGLSAPHAVLDLSTGAVAMEFGIHIPFYTPEVPGAGNTVVAAKCLLINGSTFLQELSVALSISNDGVYNFLTVDGLSTTEIHAPTVSGDHRIGLLLDNVGGVMRVWLDGVEVDVTADTLPANTSSLRVLLQLTCANSDDNGLAGKHILMSLIENPDNFTTPFPAGSRDINGNVFN